MCGVTERGAFCEASDKLCSQSRAGSGVISGCARGRNISFAHRIVFLFTRARSLDSSNQSGPGTAGACALSRKFCENKAVNCAITPLWQQCQTSQGSIVPIPRNQKVRRIFVHGEKKLCKLTRTAKTCLRYCPTLCHKPGNTTP